MFDKWKKKKITKKKLETQKHYICLPIVEQNSLLIFSVFSSNGKNGQKKHEKSFNGDAQIKFIASFKFIWTKQWSLTE